MSHIAGQGQHRSNSTRTNRAALIIVFVIVLAVALGIGAWFATHRTDGNGPAHAGVSDVALNKAKNTPKPVTEHHGNSPDCPDTDCIAMLVNGDLLFHEGLWSHFQGPNPNATDGTAFNFDPLFAPMKQYIQASDIAVCEFETPIAQRGGPYAAYPIFNIPPEVADAARNVGYNACTHATNHSWDQGADGIARLWGTLEANGIAQTGSYKTEADSTKPLVIDSPTGGGKLGLITGTVSLNGMTADEDWQVDRLREDGDPNHDSDIQRAVDKANKAREQGADVAQLAEQLICNQQVIGSSPIIGFIQFNIELYYGQIPEWPKGTDCKSAATCFDGSNPSLPITLYRVTKYYRGMEQSGSSPGS